MKTFLPNDGKKRIELNDNGTVKQFLAFYQGHDVVVKITKSGWIEIPDNPLTPIPKNKKAQMRRQLFAVAKRCEEKAESLEKLKNGVVKPDWTTALEECKLAIEPDGKIKITRWQINETTGERKLILMFAQNINTAIGMQNKVDNYYDQQLVEAENNFGMRDELKQLLEKMAIVQPHLELRRQALNYAKQQMETALEQAQAKLNKIAISAADIDYISFKDLVEKIIKLETFFENSWTCPYLSEVNLIKKRLNLTKSAAAQKKAQDVQLQLISAKFLLNSLITSFKHEGDMEKLGAIDPIKTLAEIYNLGKTDEVMALAKSHLGGEIFHLADMLAISRMVIEREMLTPKPAISQTSPQPAISRPPKRCRKKIFNCRPEQTILNFGG